MAILGVLFILLAVACCIGSLICFIMVVVKMFKNDQSTLGIVCLVLLLFGGIGKFIAFVVGWINVSAWKTQKIMIIWTGCFIGAIAFVLIASMLIFIGLGETEGQLYTQMQGM